MLYGIDATGQLFKLDYGAGVATSVAPTPAGTTIQVIFNFLDEIYGSDSTTGRLYKWNGTDAWELAAYEKMGPRSPVIHMTDLGLAIYGSTVEGTLYQCAP
jgi:hypothetical protein